MVVQKVTARAGGDRGGNGIGSGGKAVADLVGVAKEAK